MPFIHIKSLPLQAPCDYRSILEGLSGDFAKATGIELEHITATWVFVQPECYVVAGQSVAVQSRDFPPLLVELLTPDFHHNDDVEAMLRVVAESISKQTGISVNNIFIEHRYARSGGVFDNGGIVRW